MGRLQVDTRLDPDHVRLYTKSLLLDLSALGSMLEEGMFETGVRRIGAEQELFLVNRGWRPAPIAMKVLDGLSRPEFTPEIALYNLEINLPPMALSPGCFRHLEEEVHALVGAVREEARVHDAEVVLTGILPSLTVSDLALENLTPLERYHMLNEATNRMSGGSYRLPSSGFIRLLPIGAELSNSWAENAASAPSGCANATPLSAATPTPANKITARPRISANLFMPMSPFRRQHAKEPTSCHPPTL